MIGMWECDGRETANRVGRSIQEPAADYRAIRDYTDLRVWQLAMDLAVAVHEATERFPTHERFGLTSQLRRASVSVPSDIVEGNARTRERLPKHVPAMRMPSSRPQRSGVEGSPRHSEGNKVTLR